MKTIEETKYHLQKRLAFLQALYAETEHDKTISDEWRATCRGLISEVEMALDFIG